MASINESPVVKSAIQKITRNTIGKCNVGVFRYIASTIVSGTKPIRKFMALDIEADAAKISGRM
jgi:hypothetical protein